MTRKPVIALVIRKAVLSKWPKKPSRAVNRRAPSSSPAWGPKQVVSNSDRLARGCVAVVAARSAMVVGDRLNASGCRIGLHPQRHAPDGAFTTAIRGLGELL